MDMAIIRSDYDKLLKWEDGIYKEYSFAGNDKYKQGRIQFLETLIEEEELHPYQVENLKKLIEHVKTVY
jgi:predicted metal-dependent HD superfamily phosphohydrolase